MKLKRILFRLLNFNKKFIKRIPENRKCCVIIFHDYEREFANKRLGKYADIGLNFMLKVEREYNIKATYNVVGKICELYPKTVLEIKKYGHEIASHTYLHEDPKTLSYRELEESIKKSKEAFEKLGIKINGFRSPRSNWNHDLIKILAKEKFSWNAESDNSRFPYYIKNRLLRIPIRFDDWEYQSKNMDPDTMFNKLRDIVKRGIRENSYIAIGFHPWVEGLDKRRLKVFREFIIYLTKQEDITCLTFKDISNFFQTLT